MTDTPYRGKMTTIITITVSGSTPQIHKAVIKNIIFAARPWGGKWAADVKVEDVKEDM